MKTKWPIEKLCDEITKEEKLRITDIIGFLILGFAIMINYIKMAIKYTFWRK